MKKHILFICTSNKDRSPALENYFKALADTKQSGGYEYAEYKSAGVNRHFTQRHHTTLVSKELIEWANVIVYAEDVHYKLVRNLFPQYTGTPASMKLDNKKEIVLNIGDYRPKQEGWLDEEYLTKAHLILIQQRIFEKI